jgi:hypothetical protein
MIFQKTQRRQWSWTANRLNQAARVTEVVDEIKDYWPLTLRQIYYRLVAAGDHENTRSKYNDLSKLVKQMRVDEKLPWDVLTDRARSMSDKRGSGSRDGQGPAGPVLDTNGRINGMHSKGYLDIKMFKVKWDGFSDAKQNLVKAHEIRFDGKTKNYFWTGP